jgi:chromosome segregation ATPase
MEKVIDITAKRDGFRRAGLVHSDKTQTYPLSRFTKEQLEQLKSEPMLVVAIRNANDQPSDQSDELYQQVKLLTDLLDGERKKNSELTAGLDAERQKVTDLTAELEAERQKVTDLTADLEAERQKAADVATQPDAAQSTKKGK